MADRPDSLITTTGPLPGLQLVQDINAWLEALQNTWRGSDPPPSPASGQQWIDDSAAPWLLKQYDGADWQTIWAIDESSGRPSLIAPPYRGESAPPVTYPYQWWMDTSGANPRLRQRSEENDGWVDVAEHEDGEWRPFISGEAQQVGTQSDHDEPEGVEKLARLDRLSASDGFDFDNMPLVDGAPIVENGSNSDGSFVRFSSGVQICFTAVATTLNESTYTDKTRSFPATFLSAPISTGIGHIRGTEDGSTGSLADAIADTAVATTSTSWQMATRHGSTTGTTADITLSAIGFWR